MDGLRGARGHPRTARPGHQGQGRRSASSPTISTSPVWSSRLEKLGKRLKIIIDDSKDHGEAGLRRDARRRSASRASAGAANVKRQHMASLQHNKTIVVDGPKVQKVVCGSTNFSWRGFFVQSNNAMVLRGQKRGRACSCAAFENYWRQRRRGRFRQTTDSAKLGRSRVARVSTRRWHSRPHVEEQRAARRRSRDDIGTRPRRACSFRWRSSTRPRGHPGCDQEGLGATTTSSSTAFPTRRSAASICRSRTAMSRRYFPQRSSENVPEPFNAEPTGGGGTRMHHKFVVIDFDKPTARVYLAPTTSPSPADTKNGENLLAHPRPPGCGVLHDRGAAHLRPLSFPGGPAGRQEGQEEAAAAPSLRAEPGETPWWAEDYTDARKIRDRQLFA